jgi:hypothetical protein
MSTTDATRDGTVLRLSRSDAEQLSVIEATQINRDRAQAIQERDQARNEYTLVVTPTVLAQSRSLDPETRLKLQELFEALLVQPHPATAKQSPESALLLVEMPGTGIKLVYKVDTVRRETRAVALEVGRVASSSMTKDKDNRNA